MNLTVFSACLLVLLIPVSTTAGRGGTTEPAIVRLDSSDCQSGIRALAGSNFGLLVGCEDALGTYLSILYIRSMHSVADGAWSIDDRCWRDSTWADDVTSYVWDSVHGRLYVGTSGVYGVGGVYSVEPASRRAVRVLPSGAAMEPDETTFILERVDGKRRQIEGKKGFGAKWVNFRLSMEDSSRSVPRAR